MTRLLLVIYMVILSPLAFAYNVDSPDFWEGWKRDGDVELGVFEIINRDKLSAKELINRATEDSPEHSFYVGLLYYLGYHNHAGVPFQRDHKKALQYFNKAKNRTYLQPYINYYVGMILWNGYDGVASNKTRALQYLKQAGTPESFLILAAINYDRPSEQLYWYQQLAYTDDWRAMLTVAHWYAIGRGTGKNTGEAYYWYNRACNQNIPFACEKMRSL